MPPPPLSSTQYHPNSLPWPLSNCSWSEYLPQHCLSSCKENQITISISLSFVCVMPVLPSNHKIAITPAICNEESPYQEPVWTTFPKHMSNPEEQGLVIIPIFTIHFKLFYRIESIYTRTSYSIHRIESFLVP